MEEMREVIEGHSEVLKAIELSVIAFARCLLLNGCWETYTAEFLRNLSLMGYLLMRRYGVSYCTSDSKRTMDNLTVLSSLADMLPASTAYIEGLESYSSLQTKTLGWHITHI